MHQIRRRGVPIWLIIGFGVGSLCLAGLQMSLAARAWPAWRAGAPEVYLHQHAGLLLSAASGILLALLLPIPLLLTRAGEWRRSWGWALWIAWGVLSSIVMTLVICKRWLLR
jgi:hypothetical protein